jgi:hypothetical protein
MPHERSPKRRGPKPQGLIHCNVTLVPALVEWAKEQPGGLSGLIRKLLTEERERCLKPSEQSAPALPPPLPLRSKPTAASH